MNVSETKEKNNLKNKKVIFVIIQTKAKIRTFMEFF
jgi:hypothetical protein